MTITLLVATIFFAPKPTLMPFSLHGVLSLLLSSDSGTIECACHIFLPLLIETHTHSHRVLRPRLLYSLMKVQFQHT